MLKKKKRQRLDDLFGQKSLTSKRLAHAHHMVQLHHAHGGGVHHFGTASRHQIQAQLPVNVENDTAVRIGRIERYGRRCSKAPGGWASQTTRRKAGNPTGTRGKLKERRDTESVT